MRYAVDCVKQTVNETIKKGVEKEAHKQIVIVLLAFPPVVINTCVTLTVGALKLSPNPVFRQESTVGHRRVFS